MNDDSHTAFSATLKKRRNRHLKIGLSILLSALLLFYLGAQVEWREVAAESRDLAWWMVIPLLLVTALQVLLRAWRWYYLFPHGSRPSVVLLFDALNIGNLASYILPLRAGEFVRPGVVSVKAQLGFSQTFASVVIERFFDLSIVLLSFCWVALKVPYLDPWIYTGAFGLSFLAITVLGMMVIGTLAPRRASQASSYCISLCEKLIGRNALTRKIDTMSIEFIHGLGVIRSLRILGAISLLSVGIWVVTYISFYLFCLAGAHFPDSLLLAVAAAVIVGLAVAAPSAPGFIGVYQTGCVAAFVLLGYKKETGLAFGLLTHIFQYLFVVGAGLLSLWRQGVQFRDMTRMAESADSESLSF